MGDLNVPATEAPVAWKTISPRLSLTYDITGDGKNVVKLSVARYGSQSGNALASNLFPSRETDFYWFDKNADNVPNWDEVMNGYYYYMANNYGYYNYSGPMQFWTNTQFVDYAKGLRKTQYNDSYNTPLLDELTLSFEKALADDIALSVTGFYKRRHNLARSHRHHARRLARDRGQLVCEGSRLPGGRHVRPALCPQGEARSAPISRTTAAANTKSTWPSSWPSPRSCPTSGWPTPPSPIRIGRATRRRAEHFNLNNFDYYQDAVVAPETSGSGLSGIFINSRWMFKLSGLYQLPWGLNISAVFQAREGYVIPYSIQIYLGASSGGLGWVNMYEGGKKFGDDRLKTFSILNLGLEKVFKISDTTNATVFVDWYNVTNKQATLKVDNNIGPTKDDVLMVTNPGNFQFGIRVNF